VQDKLGLVDFPMPQFILIGKQSVGKSRLIESLAGETFNFISGTLGSRRPTVLEFRNAPAVRKSKWFMRDRETNQWLEHPVQQVMALVGAAHEELGESVSPQPVYVRIESAWCVDMQIVDLPGFRDFAVDSSKQDLSNRIEELVMTFMRDKSNVMLCVEQANDAATMSTLQKCRQVDPKFERTVLIRNKLDKYYADLTPENVNQWVRGFGDLPDNLDAFALTLPWWRDGVAPPKPFCEMRQEKNAEDLSQLQSKGLNAKHLETIGFATFASFMERKIEKMFSASIGPVLGNLRDLQKKLDKSERELQSELTETNPQRILSTTRECGVSFATALTHVMEGVLNLKPVMSLEEELRQFEAHHKALGSTHIMLLPSEDFSGLSEYIDYLRNEIQISTCDVELNGGAQFRRLLYESEIFLRFSEASVEVQKRDVIQARGISTGSLTWRDVVVKLLSAEAHQSLERRIQYVGERIKWFFQNQKEAVVEFMSRLEGTPFANMYSPLYPKHAKLIKQNEMIKNLIFQAYDKACARQLSLFVELFDNMLSSTFSNPWVFLKTPGHSNGGEAEGAQDAAVPSFNDTKERIPRDIQARAGTEAMLSRWLTEIPSESHQIDEAVEKVQTLLLRTYGFIRARVCDQVELFAESFFKLPMLRRLEEDMAMIDLTAEDEAVYQARRSNLQEEMTTQKEGLAEINWCIERLHSFKLKCEAKGVRHLGA
jgi:GTP-binding protein EngB required for normal cell division